MDLYTALQNRRSIRKYKPDPVPRELLKKVLESARLAPSWANKQCWSFIVVEDEKKQEKLAATLHEGNPAAKAVKQAPVTITACADPSASGTIDGKEYYLLDTGLAIQQLMLAAQAEGLGTCWVAWFDEKAAREVINVPQQQKIVALTPLGFPAREGTVTPRRELAEIVYHEEWGNKTTM